MTVPLGRANTLTQGGKGLPDSSYQVAEPRHQLQSRTLGSGSAPDPLLHSMCSGSSSKCFTRGLTHPFSLISPQEGLVNFPSFKRGSGEEMGTRNVDHNDPPFPELLETSHAPLGFMVRGLPSMNHP